MKATWANSRVAELPPSGIRAVFDRKRATSIDLSIGQPSIKPDPEPFVVAADWVRQHGCPYPPYQGIAELRNAVAQVYGGRFFRSADNVCVTNGSQEAIYLAVKALLEPGRDEVLVVNPGYPSYSRCCDLEGVTWRSARASATDSFRVRADAILEALTPSTRLIALGSPSNPSGSMLSRDDAAALASGLAARPGPPVLVLVDEVYRELTYASDGLVSLADTYPHTIVVQSLSKSCALTGLRLGFFIGPEKLVSIATRAHQLMLMAVSMPSQQVALHIFRQPERLRAHLPWYQQQRSAMLDAARSCGVPVIEPEGAFYVMVSLPARWRTDSLGAAHALLDELDVVTVPGTVFGSQAEGYLRITWAAPIADVREGFARIAEFSRANA